MPMLDTLVRLRYPADADVRKGPVKLKALDAAAGYVADNGTWKSGLTAIAKAKDFKGDVTKSSWLATEDVAFIYRACSTYDRLLSISVSPSAVVEANSDVAINVDDSKLKDWKKLECFDGAQKVGEVAAGAPAKFTAARLAAGYHAFSVLATDTKGNQKTSNPVLVVVRLSGPREENRIPRP